MAGMSQSMQSSVLIQQQLHHHQQFSQHPSSQARVPGIGRCSQILLVSALCGIEMCVSFEQIYQILFLQYLGVPVALVSVNGIVCGATSMIMLPILGVCTDKGSNPKLRKLCSLLVGLSMFLSGLVMLGSSGFIKLASGPRNSTSDNTTTSPSPADVSYNKSFPATSSEFSDYTVMAVEAQTVDASGELDYAKLPVTAYLAIAGFALIDIGFDMSVSLTRAFVLEIVPAFQHTQVLVLATIAQSIAGTSFSLVGCIDFPGTLGPLFQVEGVAATIIFFCTFLCCMLVTGYVCTTVTGYFLGRKMTSRLAQNEAGEHRNVAFPVGELTPKTRRPLRSRRRLNLLPQSRPYKADIRHTEEGDGLRQPLLLEDSLDYSATSLSLSSQLPDPVASRGGNRSSRPSQSSETADRDLQDHVAKGAEKDAVFGDSAADDISANGVASPASALKQSFSQSQSTTQSPLGEFHQRKLAELRRTPDKVQTQEPKRRGVNKRLVILCVATFFSIGGMLGIVVYSSNCLTVGIFHGEPQARPGSDGYRRYEDGIRMAAFGNLVLYVTYLAVSLSNKKIIDVIGERTQFVIGHLLLVVVLLVLLVTRLVEVYFVFMVFCGAFRSCVYTLSFILANKFTHDEVSGVCNDDVNKPGKSLGKIMSLIGFLIPSHYILLSAFMGPLMDATDNVWTPLMYSLASISLALVIFTTLFFVKH
ncbi:unnamed protein product [Lymnaea stagnalis]|uniref:Uncharacterized protein n=1 Tax=Lymnaea stagnalis TaxID=6523 RepID=A0AAV2HQW9_LYMST